LSNLNKEIVNEYYQIFSASGAISVSSLASEFSGLGTISIQQQIQEMLSKTFKMLGIADHLDKDELIRFLMLTKSEQSDQLLYSILVILVIFAYSLLLNNSQFA